MAGFKYARLGKSCLRVGPVEIDGDHRNGARPLRVGVRLPSRFFARSRVLCTCLYTLPYLPTEVCFCPLFLGRTVDVVAVLPLWGD